MTGGYIKPILYFVGKPCNMKYSLLLLLVVLICACNFNESNENKAAPDEKTQALEVSLVNHLSDSLANAMKQVEIKGERKLRYVFASNGGIIGYFSDGSVAGCQRCDYKEENMDALMTAPTHATYTVGKQGLIVDGENISFDMEGWKMIDYKWSQLPE